MNEIYLKQKDDVDYFLSIFVHMKIGVYYVPCPPTNAKIRIGGQNTQDKYLLLKHDSMHLALSYTGFT